MLKSIKTIELQKSCHNGSLTSVVFDIDNLFDKYRFHITYHWQEQNEMHVLTKVI